MPGEAGKRSSRGSLGRRLGLVVALALVLAFGLAGSRDGKPTVTSLERQLAGEACRFEGDDDGCRLRAFHLFDLLARERHTCDLWAVRCLGRIGGPDAVQALVRVLATKADVETCDGVVPVRSMAVAVLGSLGDPSAVEPLRRLKASRPHRRLSAGASGCPAGPEGDHAIDEALRRLEP